MTVILGEWWDKALPVSQGRQPRTCCAPLLLESPATAQGLEDRWEGRKPPTQGNRTHLLGEIMKHLDRLSVGRAIKKVSSHLS